MFNVFLTCTPESVYKHEDGMGASRHTEAQIIAALKQWRLGAALRKYRFPRKPSSKWLLGRVAS
jgi:hypothetical protein